METEMNRLLQSEQSDRTPWHVVGIEDRERTYYSLRVKYLTDYCPGFFILRFADEYRLATQVMQRRGLIDVAGFCTGPVRMHELVEKFAAAAAGGRDAEHPKISVRLSKLRWRDRRKVRRRQIIDHGGLHHPTVIQSNHKTRRLAFPHGPEQIPHHPVVAVDRAPHVDYVTH